METEKIQKTKVSIKKSGIYPISPFKMEYKTFSNENGAFETIQMTFSLQIGYKISSYVRKTIFFKGDAERINKEINYLLKFICPDCLKNNYQEKTFKGYVEKLAEDINKQIRSDMENNTVPLLFGKVIKKRDSNFPELQDLFSKNGYQQDYLSFPDSVGKNLYFTEWEIENLDTPFSITEKAAQPVTGSSAYTGKTEDSGSVFTLNTNSNFPF